MSDKDGGPAFPLYAGWIAETSDRAKAGMTLRDYFAASALRGCCEWDAIINEKKAVFADSGGIEKLAKTAYAIADAMLKARGQ